MSLKPVNYNEKLSKTLKENPKYKLYVKLLRFIRNIKINLARLINNETRY